MGGGEGGVNAEMLWVGEEICCEWGEGRMNEEMLWVGVKME